MDLNHAWYGEDLCVLEHQWQGTVPGTFLGITGQARPISFRMLHVFDRFSRDNVWLEGNAIVEQLATTELA
jgi:hypothetical protein